MSKDSRTRATLMKMAEFRVKQIRESERIKNAPFHRARGELMALRHALQLLGVAHECLPVILPFQPKEAEDASSLV